MQSELREYEQPNIQERATPSWYLAVVDQPLQKVLKTHIAKYGLIKLKLEATFWKSIPNTVSAISGKNLQRRVRKSPGSESTCIAHRRWA